MVNGEKIAMKCDIFASLSLSLYSFSSEIQITFQIILILKNFHINMNLMMPINEFSSVELRNDLNKLAFIEFLDLDFVRVSFYLVMGFVVENVIVCFGYFIHPNKSILLILRSSVI